MSSLTDSREWLLLRDISEWLSQRKAPYRAVPINETREIRFDADLLEFELRRTFFTIQNFPQSLRPEKFVCFQKIIEQLCSLLDRLAAHQEAGDEFESEGYVHLVALRGLPNPNCEPIDLVNGPEQRLFELPSDTAELHEYLTAVTNCNNALNELLAPLPLELVTQPSRREQKESPWKKGQIRDRAICVLETLFKHFKCGIRHDILLKLAENSNEDMIVSCLQLMLPSCPEVESWKEVRYDNADM